MRKKILAFFSILFIFLCFHACDYTIPSAVEVIMDPEIGMRIRSGDLNKLIEDTIKDAVAGNSGEGDNITVLRYNGYKYDGKNQVQTFLLQYNIMRDEPLDFLDDLDEVFDFDMDLGDLSRDIDLSDLANIDGTKGPSKLNIDVTQLTESALEQLETNDFAGDFTLPIAISGIPTQEIEYDPFLLKGFESITFFEGIFTIELEYTITTLNYNNVDFSFDSIYIKNDNAENIYTEDIVHFTGSVRKQTIKFDLAGKTLRNPRIVLDGFIDASLAPSRVANVSIGSDRLLSNPKSGEDKPVVQGIEKLELDNRIEIELDAQPIDLNFGNSGFIHAIVGDGSINFNIDLPSEIIPNQTWINFFNNSGVIDNTVDTDIYIFQAPIDYAGNGVHYQGLSAYKNGTGSDTDPWKYVSGANNLNGRHINLTGINIVSDTITKSKITLPDGKVSFMLSGDDLSTQEIKIDITPEIDIKTFSEAHIDSEDFLKPEPSKKVPITGAAKYIREIHFDKIGIRLNFGRIDIEGFEIMITEKNLEINLGEQYCDVVQNGNSGDKFINTNFTWDLKDAYDVLLDELEFEFDLKKKVSVPGDNVIKATDLDLEDGKLVFEIDYEIFFKDSWTYANLDLLDEEDRGGSYPGEDEDGINLAKMFELLEGFTFEEVKAYLYVNGPNRFFNLKPDVEMEVNYPEKTTDFRLFLEDSQYDSIGNLKLDFTGKNSALLNLDPKGTGSYSGALPELNKSFLINIKDIMKDRPTDLRFIYNVLLHDQHLTVYPEDMIKDNAENLLNAVMVMVLPMRVKAEEDGSDFEIPNMFKDKADLFDRKKSGDSSYADYVNSLTVKLQLPGKLFTGGTFYMKREGEEDSENEILSFKLSNSINQEFVISEKKLKQINDIGYPYKIVKMGVRFPEGTIVEIPEKLGLVKVEIDADVHFEYKFR